MKWCQSDWGSWGVLRRCLCSAAGSWCRIVARESCSPPQILPSWGAAPLGAPLCQPQHKKLPREMEGARCSLHELLLQRGCWSASLAAQDFPAGPPRTCRCFHVIEYLKHTRKANKINSNQACSAKQQIHSPLLLLSPLLTKFSSWPGCCLFYFAMFKAFKVPRRPRG